MEPSRLLTSKGLPAHSQATPSELRWSLTSSRPLPPVAVGSVCVHRVSTEGVSWPWGSGLWETVGFLRGEAKEVSQPAANSLPASQASAPRGPCGQGWGSQQTWALQAEYLISADEEFNEGFQRGQTVLG